MAPMLQIQCHQASSSPSAASGSITPRPNSICSSTCCACGTLAMGGSCRAHLHITQGKQPLRAVSGSIHHYHQSRASTPCIDIHVVLPRISSYFGLPAGLLRGLHLKSHVTGTDNVLLPLGPRILLCRTAESLTWTIMTVSECAEDELHADGNTLKRCMA